MPPLRNLLFVLTLISIAAGLGYFASRHHIQRDVTYNANNSLDPISVEVLKQLTGPCRNNSSSCRNFFSSGFYCNGSIWKNTS